MGSHLLEEVFGCTNPSPPQSQQQDRRPRPQPEQALRCPRCDSTNTKFCYYNNYSLSQPRYFCKGCRRYWTKGGTLRNVPVGAGAGRTRDPLEEDPRPGSSTNPPPPPPPPLTFDHNELSLAFARLQKPPPTGQRGLDDHHYDSFMPQQAPGFLDDSLSSFSSLYYGLDGQGLLPFEMLSGATAAIKQEPSYRWVEGDTSRLLMGLQWPVAVDGDVTVEAGREYWNGLGSTWQHGLVNSFLI
ncbi:unnamed protein product [Spirodela intermedia]|uniref:Dof zinc finger protein n=1 Tax=Spirodela intermedia TaxID=51605 RepID=A0A7I8IB53_SPIIN|nr:unnamed protein product [Spirodela intermedia]CAA6654810.1 unnamed protein product [Spirodela intermedia]